jgi:myo-inositol-1(or 4)-monophosphatase
MSIVNPEIRVMLKAAEKAGRSLLRDFGEVENLQVSVKGPGDFVSAADKRAEQIIYEILKEARPDYGFCMEESGVIEGSKNIRYIIDPLDGTTNFLHGLPHWAISIALEKDGEIVAGLVSDPVKNEMFTAVRGEGAFSGRKRLRVSGRNDPLMSVIVTGAPRRVKAEQQLRFVKEYDAMQAEGYSLRRFGAAALDLAYVAAGRCEAFWERDLSAWDLAAGSLLVKEAGGFVSELDSDQKNPVETGHILAGNAHVQPEIKKLLRSLGK